jgi:D-beta-D-heptose 7-phosphate kinase/D-beta-D-heptose 1-phosphate adenosyltransferase
MSDAGLQKTLSSLPGKRVLVVGDVILDEYVWGEVRRISPEAPVPVVDIRSHSHVPGGAGNAAANVVSLGGTALLGGVVGEDAAADSLVEALRQGGVDAGGLVREAGRQTTTKTRVIAHSQHVVRFDREHKAALSAAAEEALLRWVDRQLGEVDACVLSDYAKGAVTDRVAAHVLAGARRAGKPVVVDPKATDYAKYRGATVLKPNLAEAERFLRQEIRDADGLLEAGRCLVGALDGSAVLITRGAEGMSLFRRGAPPLHVPAVARHVFDVTGAGDTVISTLALALAAGAPPEQAVALANLAAGVAVGKVGTARVTLAELRAAGRAELAYCEPF